MKHIDIFIFVSITYIEFKILENIIWRCPKGKYTNTINKCLYCNYELI